jgi:sugar-phosphatase
VSAVVFDLDGVLVESEPYWQRAFADTANAWLDAAGSTRPRLDDADMTRFEGGRVNETLEEILDEVRAEIDDPHVGGDDFLDHATSSVVVRVAVDFAAAPQTIAASVDVARQLHGRGTRLAVASSSSEMFIETALQVIGLDDAFAVRCSALQLERGKPHPQVYLDAIDALGERPEDCVAIEDSSRGIAAAVAARIPCLGLWRGQGDPPAAFEACAHVTRGLTVDDVDLVLEGKR